MMYDLRECKKEIDDARNLQKAVRESDNQKRETGIDYDEKHVRQSIVHTREDIAAFVPLVTHLLLQTKRINQRLNIIIALEALAKVSAKPV